MSAPRLKENWQERLQNLKPGWDGYGGLPITEAAIQTVENIYVVPTGDGGIQLEWHDHDQDVEINIAPNGAVECFYLNRVTHRQKEGEQ